MTRAMLIATSAALSCVIEELRASGAGAPLPEGGIGQHVWSLDAGGRRWLVHRTDDDTSPLALVDQDALNTIADSDSGALERGLERVDRVLRGFREPPIQLPPSWHKFQHQNRIAFFALPRHLNGDSLRWIAEHCATGDVAFWTVTSRENETPLADAVTDVEGANQIRSDWPTVRARAQDLLPPDDGSLSALRPTVDLESVGAAAVSRERPFDVWLPDLTAQQRKVLAHQGVGALKVRGPAGTGKTLILQLKALAELYRAVDNEETVPRILYLTHSWALADLVLSSLSSIDSRGIARENIEVMPLDWVRDELHGDLPEGTEVLGEDSLAGKRQQLTRLSRAIDDLVSSDWTTYRDRVSADLRTGVENGAGTAERTILAWKIMREITEVIDAQGLKPGLNALQKYIEVPREPWMVELPEKADREFVYTVYRGFLRRLEEEGQLTSDQALDDFRRYLESYAWNLRRRTEGFDLIFVDEFHLFSDTERYLIHLLTRDPEAAPRLFLALDPYQSVFTLLTGIPGDYLSRAARENAYPTGGMSEVELNVVHRFSTEILRFVKHIHESFPNLVDVGDDWVVDLASAESSRAGVVPEAYVLPTEQEAAKRALRLAESINRDTGASDRTALIATGAAEFLALEPLLRSKAGVTVIQSREDLDQLGYTRRALVATTAEFSAGLQFSHVVVLGFAGRAAGGTSSTRAALSELYLAVTRAEQSVRVVTTSGDGQIADLIARAIEHGYARRVE